MDEQKSFKERVKETVIYNARLYKRYYVDYEYLICSKSFLRNEYYIISAHEDNYLHLTGLHTSLGASKFFEKCYDGTLEETDFEKDGQTESEVKGSVRRKINSLPSIMYMFSGGTMVEEDFVKNRIRCALAAGNTSATLGFAVAGKAKPMTLLKGNELDSSKAKKIDLVLRRESGKEKFEDVIVGNREMLNTYKDSIVEIVPEELFVENKWFKNQGDCNTSMEISQRGGI